MALKYLQADAHIPGYRPDTKASTKAAKAHRGNYQMSRVAVKAVLSSEAAPLETQAFVEAELKKPNGQDDRPQPWKRHSRRRFLTSITRATKRRHGGRLSNHLALSPNPRKHHSLQRRSTFPAPCGDDFWVRTVESMQLSMAWWNLPYAEGLILAGRVVACDGQFLVVFQHHLQSHGNGAGFDGYSVNLPYVEWIDNVGYHGRSAITDRHATSWLLLASEIEHQLTDPVASQIDPQAAVNREHHGTMACASVLL
ncbi:hypothetical protein OPT61_g8217 [Boeremia exigua]|uniref:Uncharacterized protein n=1 Tax=Boeremia exigua TaxID=749465 RepID=A0ACC2HZR1_9PLEO|nr:hypothetical protein OPT61_g8217 [Boeremia exigua]